MKILEPARCPSKVLQRNMHMVVGSKRLVAIGTFPRSGRPSLLDALFAEHMPAGLDCCVLEVDPTDGADGQSLNRKTVSDCYRRKFTTKKKKNHLHAAFHTRRFGYPGLSIAKILNSSLSLPAEP